MSFPFGASSGGGASKGPDLETIQTEALGFLSIAGDAKVRLTSSWSDLPAPSSSLLSVASRKGLVAAAGPDQIIIATTEAIRKAFESPKDGDSDVRAFEPQLKIPMSMRVSQLVFTADENYLVLSAESGGGLAVYEVQSLLGGSSASAFELSTNGEALRALAPNPTPEKAELVAIVTDGGNLHMANLRDRSISNALKGQVSCVSWSSKGKQLCAGLADGSIHQMTPEGEGKAEIPTPPGQSNCHVSSLTWLENNLFLAIHSTADSPPTSTYHVITRQSPGAFEYRQLTDPIEPFGSEKTPQHTLLRLRDFPPDLQDLLIVSSTASTEVGLLTRSKNPLASDKPADSITGVFTTTELLDDTKRPTLPMTDSMDDSTAIGIALDLSATNKVYKPIPADDELEESPSPLPGFWILTHEGILCSWWVVYTDSIRQATTYPGLSIVQGPLPEQTSAPAQNTTTTTTTTTTTAIPFSTSTSGASPFASSIAAAPAFGSAASLGQKASPWGASGTSNALSATGGAAFGSSTFGSSTSAAPAFGQSSFGQSSQIGAKASPWASAGASSATPAFGQSGFASFASKSTSSPFGAASSSQTPGAAPASGGFAGFASSGGFASLSGNSGGSSVFGSGAKPAGSVFGSGSTNTAFPSKSDSVFGAASSASAFGSQEKLGSVFGAPQDKPSESVFGSSPFKLQSSFKADPSQKEEVEKPSSGTTGASMFGSSFGSALTAAHAEPTSTTPSAKDEDMDTVEAGEETPKSKPSPAGLGSTATAAAPEASKFGGFPSSTAGSLFGQPSKPLTSASGLFGAPKTESTGTSGLFGSTSAPSSQSNVFGSSIGSKSGSALPGDVKVKKSVSIVEPVSFPPDLIEASKSADDSQGSDFVNVPKPTEAKTAELPSEQPAETTTATTSIISKPGPAAAISGFTFPTAAKLEEQPDATTIPPLEDGGSDLEEDNVSEGSGVDVAKDLSPTIAGLAPSLPSQTSSFGGLGGPSISLGKPQQASSSLFSNEASRAAASTTVPRTSPLTAAPRAASPMTAAGLSPNQRLAPTDLSKSAIFPSMTSPASGALPKSPLSLSVGSRGQGVPEDFIAAQKKLKERQDAEQDQLLVDEEDDEVQRVLASEIEPTLDLDEFIAHTNVAPPAKDSIPAQVEAVYRDINSMIDTLGLNARSVKAFTKGHSEMRTQNARTKDDLEEPDDWILCEISELGEVLEKALPADLAEGRVRDLPDKLDVCQDLARDLHRLRAKQEDLNRIISTKLDPSQMDLSRSLPLSTEQATQQNELRREYTSFSKALGEAEEALTLLKTRIASISSATGRGNSNVPTVDAVIRTIAKMTSMVEKRSGDVDVLETQLRKLRLDSLSREGSPLRTPQQQLRRSILMSLDSTPSRAPSNMSSSIMSFGGASVKGATSKKKLSGFSREEKIELMDKRIKRQALLAKLKENVQRKGVKVWTMEDTE